jgi:hypothetical protein
LSVFLSHDEEDTRKRFESLGIEIAPRDKRASAWLAPFIKSEVARWKPLLEAELAQQRQ